MSPQIILPTTAPNYVGTYGRAWRYDLEALHRNSVARHGSSAPTELQVCAWAVHAPHSHPIWPCVTIACISLREFPGWPPAHIYAPGATHEVLVMALDPGHPVALDAQPHHLRPLNYAGQFVAASDAEARDRVDSAVLDVCNGTLNPDSDGRHQWAARFGRSMFKADADTPDFLALKAGGDMLMKGTGGANTRALQQVVETSATLAADESKPQ